MKSSVTGKTLTYEFCSLSPSFPINIYSVSASFIQGLMCRLAKLGLGGLEECRHKSQQFCTFRAHAGVGVFEGREHSLVKAEACMRQKNGKGLTKKRPLSNEQSLARAFCYKIQIAKLILLHLKSDLI